MTEHEQDVQRWLTTAEAARRLEVSDDTVRSYCRKGWLVFKGTRLGMLIDPESVAELKETLPEKKAEQKRKKRG